MARFSYTVLSRSQPGQEEEFVRWYIEQHLPDVVRMPGVVSAKLHRMDFQRVYDIDAPQWTLMTLYELEGDDPGDIALERQHLQIEHQLRMVGIRCGHSHRTIPAAKTSPILLVDVDQIGRAHV